MKKHADRSPLRYDRFGQPKPELVVHVKHLSICGQTALQKIFTALTSVLNPSKSGKTTLNLGIGHYKSESALGLIMAHWIKTKNMGEKTKKIVVNGGAFFVEGGEDTVYRVGVGMEF